MLQGFSILTEKGRFYQGLATEYRPKKILSQPSPSIFIPFTSFVTFFLFSFLLPASAYCAQVTLRWDSIPGAELTGYKLYYKTGSGGAPYNGTGAAQGPSPIDIPIESLENPNNPECMLSGLDYNKIYFFALTAYNSHGESAYSREVVYETPGPNLFPILILLLEDNTPLEARH